MRHVFILNPIAGKGQGALALRERIEAYFSVHPDAEYTIRETTCPGDATAIAAEECAAGGRVRLYACGGDGTLQETANGIPVGSSVELAVVPCGSGNDYVRTFGGKDAFLDLSGLIEGTAVPVDAVDCNGRLSLNIAAIGMDAKVAAKMTNYKNLPGVGGSLAYELAIVDVLFHPLGDEMEIVIKSENGEQVRSGKYLIALAANGQYYGGGYRGAPHAVADDGVLDFVLVKKISRLRIVKFISKYKAGNYDDLPFCEHIRGTSMRVRTQKATYFTVDGECSSQTEMAFDIVPGACNFVLPASVAAARASTERVVSAPVL